MLTSCGGGNGQVTVTVSATNGDDGKHKAGDRPTYVVSVTNQGPGDAPGVQVRVDLPTSFRYKSTGNIRGLGNARTQPLDPQVGVSSPLWGYWNLAAPNLNAPKDDRLSHVDIAFTVDVAGSPDTYSITGHAQGDNTAGTVNSNDLAVEVQPAPHLAVQATVSPTTLKANAIGTYRVTVTNSGDGPANNLSVLITLPSVMGFQQSVLPFAGNASRATPVDPQKNSVLVFYAGFNLPARSTAGPGFVTIVFKALVAGKPPSGTYPISVQLTDNDQDQVSLVDAAPVTISGVTPSPSPRASPTPGT